MYKSAALHGQTGAQYNLGVFYENGLGGFSINKTEAARFYRMAAEAGDEYAKHNLSLLRKQMETEEHARSTVEPYNLLFSVFKTVKQPSELHVQKSLRRCSSCPGILDAILMENEPQCTHATSATSKTSNPLLAF